MKTDTLNSGGEMGVATSRRRSSTTTRRGILSRSTRRPARNTKNVINLTKHRDIKEIAKAPLGTYLKPHTTLTPEFLYTASHVLQHYLFVWEPDSAKNIKRLQRLGFRVWGNRKNKTKKDSKSLEHKTVENKMITTVHSPAKALVAENDTSIVITFRGSGVQKNTKDDKAFVKAAKATFQNMIADLDIRLVKNKNFPGYVHRGFLREYMHIRKAVINAVKKCENYENKQIFVSGFSLGAAMGTLCFWDIQRTLKLKKKPCAYLFACPAAGDKSFESALTKKNNSIFRFAHERDPIAQIPHSLFKSFRAPGNNYFVFETKKATSASRAHNSAEQLNHRDMELNIEMKGILGKLLSAKAMTPVRWKAAKAILIAKAIKDVAIPFRFHNGYVYQKSMIKIAENFKKRTHSGTTLRKTAQQFRKLAAKTAITSDFLKKK